MSATIWLRDTLKHGASRRFDLTQSIKPTWRRSTRRKGGFWKGGFTLSEKNNLPAWRLFEFYSDWLMNDLVEKVGGMTTWQGYVAELRLTAFGVTYTRSLISTYDAENTPFANALKCAYERVGNELLTNGSGETGAWTAYNSATVTQSTEWVTHGVYGIKIVVADTAIRGAYIQTSVTIAAGKAYDIKVEINALSGSWRVSVNKAVTDESLAFFSTRGATGRFTASMRIDETNQYAGAVDFRITAEASAGTLYADGASFREATRAAETGWTADANSIADYGRSEYILREQQLTDAQADARVKGLLAAMQLGTRLPNDVTIPLNNSSRVAGTQLDVVALGYVHTLRNYALPRASAAADVQLKALLAGHDFVSAGLVSSNSHVVQLESTEARRQWDVLENVIDQGDGTGAVWGGGVYANARFNYEAASTTPVLRVYNGQLRDANNQAVIDPEFLSPGLCRIQNTIGPAVRDVFIEEVELDAGRINLRQRG